MDDGQTPFFCIRAGIVLANELVTTNAFNARLSAHFLARAAPTDQELDDELLQVTIRFRAIADQETVAWTIPDREPLIIFLNRRLQAAARYADRRQGNPIYARAVFFFGVTIMHELVHLADEWFQPAPRRPDEMRIQGFPEAMDAGSLVELALFGGTVEGFNFSLSRIGRVYILRPIRSQRRPRRGQAVDYVTARHSLTDHRIAAFVSGRAPIPPVPRMDDTIRAILDASLGPGWAP